jgi:shikimate dehydrogenase
LDPDRSSSPVGLAAVLGKPIAHSLSPVLHRAAYAALGLNGWRYDAIECDEGGLAELVSGSDPRVVGYSCTMPLKRELLRVAGTVSAQAAAIGAGNTLLRVGDEWHADNTDWIGIRDSLAANGVAASGDVVLLGAGGTAQAALAALAGAHEVTVLVREPGRARTLLEAADRLDRQVRISTLDEHTALRDAELVISTLPSGAADGLAELPWRAGQSLLDASYHPWPSRLATAFDSVGGQVVSGAAMLLYQAARQVELMTGRAAPVPAMRAAIAAAAPGTGLVADPRSA